jgi:hypothetical protein
MFLAISNFSTAARVFDSSEIPTIIKSALAIPEEQVLLLCDKTKLGEGGNCADSGSAARALIPRVKQYTEIGRKALSKIKNDVLADAVLVSSYRAWRLPLGTPLARILKSNNLPVKRRYV